MKIIESFFVTMAAFLIFSAAPGGRKNFIIKISAAAAADYDEEETHAHSHTNTHTQQLKGKHLRMAISVSVTSRKFTDINECCDLEKSIKTLRMT
jgi:hypothetical protein